MADSRLTRGPMHRTFLFMRLAFCAATGVLACGSTAPSAGAFSPACLHYAGYTTGGQCGNPALPKAEVARVTPRWAQHCEDVLALPGSTITADALDKCLTVLEAGGCWAANTPDACVFPSGTLTVGAACNERGVQCQSGACSGPLAQQPCGACLPSVSIGGACDQQQATNVCVAGSSCNATATGAACATLTLGPVGAACSQSSDCVSGLICNPTTLMCAAPPGAGAPCVDPFGCAYPLVCNVNPTTGSSATCQPPGGPGTPCLTDEFCTRPLGCSMTDMTCGVVSWQAAGQPCDGDMIRCLVGACPTTSAPVCPTVVPDGGVCTAGDDAQTCDAGSVCFAGKCALGSSVACQ
jgi:hypothetical protein